MVVILSDHLKASFLAKALGCSRGRVYAMKFEGYRFEFGKTTTLAHAEAWLRGHPNFSTAPYYRATPEERRRRMEELKIA